EGAQDTMAIIMNMEWPGLTRAQFDAARKRVRWEEEPPKGSIVQSQGWNGDTFIAADIWESVEDWNNFLQNRILPNLEGLDIEGEPTIRISEAYLVFVPGLHQPAMV